MLVTLMTDASVCPDTGAAGYGYWVVSQRGGKPGQGRIKGKVKDSFEGEFKAVFLSLFRSVKDGSVKSGDHVLIQLDNSGVVNCLNKVNKVRDINNDVFVNLQALLRTNKFTIQARHVKGHSNQVGQRYSANRLCDIRAKEEMLKGRKEYAN